MKYKLSIYLHMKTPVTTQYLSTYEKPRYDPAFIYI